MLKSFSSPIIYVIKGFKSVTNEYHLRDGIFSLLNFSDINDETRKRIKNKIKLIYF